MLQKVLEELVRSDRWRCPYVSVGGHELCEQDERYVQNAVSNFLNYDFPALKEMFK
jgi:hypothetical protein